MTLIPDLLNKLSKWIDKVIPGKKGRTALIALLGVLYGVIGFVVGNLTADQAAQTILTSLGLIFAANHVS